MQKTPAEIMLALMKIKGIWFKTILGFKPDKRLTEPFALGLAAFEGADPLMVMVAYFNCGI